MDDGFGGNPNCRRPYDNYGRLICEAQNWLNSKFMVAPQKGPVKLSPKLRFPPAREQHTFAVPGSLLPRSRYSLAVSAGHPGVLR